MPINLDFIGRSFPATAAYTVSREKIREFAAAIGEASPACLDPSAAQALGYPDVVAPPTFAIVLTRAAARRAVAEPGLRLDYAKVVHGTQRFTYTRPIHAGDVLTVAVTIDSIRTSHRHNIITTRSEVTTLPGEHICTAYATLIERDGALP